MMTRLRTGTLALTAAAAVAAGAFAVAAPQEGGPQDPMQKWMEAGKPGPQHAMLGKMAGEWTAVAEMSMAPGAPPMKTPATATIKKMFEGRFVQQTYKSTFMGMPFEGYGLMGYDNTAKRYHSVWLDSTGTGSVISYGTEGEKKNVIAVKGEYANPMSGGTTKARNVYTIVDDDNFTMEMFEEQADGSENLTVKITYTRKK